MKHKFMTACFLGIVVLSLTGCSKELTLNVTTNCIEAPMLAFGPQAKLAKIDKEIMLPALQVVENYQKETDKEKVTWLEKELAVNKEAQVKLAKEEIIRLNDAFLYFANRYLKAEQQYLETALALSKNHDQAVATKLTKQLEQIKDMQLEDARMAFLNARQLVAHQPSIYKLQVLTDKQLHKGMTYTELRSLLNMPGERLEKITVPQLPKQAGKIIEPVVWVQNGKYLYVEFVNGKSNSWKLSSQADIYKQNTGIQKQFPGRIKGRLAKKPTVKQITNWFKQPSELVHRHLVPDAKNPKRTHRYDINIWVQGDGFFCGQFLDDRLQKWQGQKLNDGFYHDK